MSSHFAQTVAFLDFVSKLVFKTALILGNKLVFVCSEKEFCCLKPLQERGKPGQNCGVKFIFTGLAWGPNFKQRDNQSEKSGNNFFFSGHGTQIRCWWSSLFESRELQICTNLRGRVSVIFVKTMSKIHLRGNIVQCWRFKSFTFCCAWC